jgi:hypothetical protein
MTGRGGIACWALLALLSCAQESGTTHAPGEPQASWILKPARPGVGQVSVLERIVVTAPQFVPRPWIAPDAPAGLSLLDSQALPIEQSAGRWVHRSRIRMRAHAAGEFSWPPDQIEVEAPDGSVESVRLPEISFEVRSILPEFPERSAPFGLRQPERAASNRVGWGAALAAALGALGAIALARFALARRGETRGERDARPAREAPAPPWHTAHGAIERAAALGETDPLAAAHALSPALRRYMAARYRADTRGRTAEELRATEPAFAMRSSWPGFAALVWELDGLRFQPADAVRNTATQQLPRWLDMATHCVDATIPPEHRQ